LSNLDNTGLQAALRGFRNWVNQRGQDPRLPDNTGVLDQFTNEQLFFLGYAQQYCPKTDLYWYNFGSKPSPNEYRLLGALSNSQAFRSSFNCEDDKKYTPKDNCQIWTSKDANPDLGVPKSEEKLPPLGVPTNPQSSSDGYLSCSKTLEEAIDTQVDPCDDFYGYVCKRYNGPGSFADVLINNQVRLIKALKKPNEHAVSDTN
jgi:hypothetical protein